MRMVRHGRNSFNGGSKGARGSAVRSGGRRRRPTPEFCRGGPPPALPRIAPAHCSACGPLLCQRLVDALMQRLDGPQVRHDFSLGVKVAALPPCRAFARAGEPREFEGDMTFARPTPLLTLGCARRFGKPPVGPPRPRPAEMCRPRAIFTRRLELSLSARLCLNKAEASCISPVRI